ncbi:MAG: putative histidine kinase, classic, partial [Ramlibacter sp.]|nr:putative histidine kinase, classic [Ramlibacter sp.]
QEGRDIVFRVEDTGIGIAPDVLPRIFDLFTQEREAADLVPSGLGIGLTIVKELVELHGGNVQARSAGSGKGAEFSVRLPAAPDG